MIEHPSVIRRRPANEEPVGTEETMEEQTCLLLEEPGDTLRSPAYWVKNCTPELESALEHARESALEKLPMDPDEMQRGMVDVRDYLPTRPRRCSRRIRAPQDLVFAYRPLEYVPVELHVLVENGVRPFIRCFLYDVNDHGICLASPAPLPTGAEVWVCAHHREEPTAMISQHVQVLSQRPCPTGDMLRSTLGELEDGLWLHGLRMPHRDARLLLRCTLDSLACQQAQPAPEAYQHAS